MSVLVIAKFTGDTAVFQASLTNREAEYKEWGEQAQARGAIHHRFAVGDGYVLVVDEWASEADFQDFISTPALQTFISEVGANLNITPEILVGTAVSSPDQV